jgi:hypothetical protein
MFANRRFKRADHEPESVDAVLFLKVAMLSMTHLELRICT